MAKPSKTAPKQTLSDDKVDDRIQPQRLRSISVKNFRSIGSRPVTIELDDIVVLVGPNNAGKSSLLRAYEVAMSEGSSGSVLVPDDFPNGKIDGSVVPEIEVETLVGEFAPASKWITVVPSGERVVRERWVWNIPGPPKRQGYDVETRAWSDEEVPWGAPNVAQYGRPKPHKVGAFDDPSEQSRQLVALLMAIVTERVVSFKNPGESEDANAYGELLRKLADAQRKIVSDSAVEIESVEKELSRNIAEIFPNHTIKFDARPEEDVDKCITFFKTNPRLLMGPIDGHLGSMELQGSGARRTMLWTALRILATKQSAAKKGKAKNDSVPSSRANVLLIDEPEICLHPDAIRDACRVLYDLPQSGNWQVMATTHSPAFIDISRDNTTIVRVERKSDGHVEGTTVFRPRRINLDEDDRKRLKLLNAYDSYVGEFFFGNRNVIVEGDTEYTAFKHVIAQEPKAFKGTHIIRARGKSTIVTLQKILNQFGSDYAVLHDSDTPKRADGNANSAWSVNQKILETAREAPSTTRVRVLASITNFERAYLGIDVYQEKPYSALERLEEDADVYNRIKALLEALVDCNAPTPAGCVQWTTLEELEKAVERARSVDVSTMDP